MNNTKKQDSVINEIRNSRGRFFGLYTNNRPAINAQFQSETPAYVMIYDRNSRTKRKLSKSSIIGVSIGGQVFGQLY
jgi:hypothetical protein